MKVHVEIGVTFQRIVSDWHLVKNAVEDLLVNLQIASERLVVNIPKGSTLTIVVDHIVDCEPAFSEIRLILVFAFSTHRSRTTLVYGKREGVPYFVTYPERRPLDAYQILEKSIGEALIHSVK